MKTIDYTYTARQARKVLQLLTVLFLAGYCLGFFSAVWMVTP